MAIDWEALPPDLAELARERFGGRADHIADVSKKVDVRTVEELPKPKRAKPHAPYDSKLEARFADHLQRMKLAVCIHDWEYHPIKIKLGGKTFYTPDFLVETKEGRVVFVETKGFMREAAAVRLKVAAGQFSWCRWLLVTSGKGHLWIAREVDDKGIGTSPIEVEWI